MEFKEIQDILKLVNKTDLTEVEIEKKDFKLKIRRKAPESNVIYATQPASAIASPSLAPAVMPPVAAEPTPVAEGSPEPAKAESTPAAPEKDYYTFKSPMIGTFYRSSSPETPPFVKVGDTVQKGSVLCIVEAMKLFNEIESEVEGKIVKVLVENAQPVEYDQPLYLIDTDA
ncbi:MAG: acetyl-CoA carboxylase biotin carboxyl carrier protein [Bacteroidota bacterium]